MKFSFDQNERSRVEVDVLSYERKPVGDYWDDNWLNVHIQVYAGGFRGNVSATIMSGELHKLLADLRLLYAELKGSSEFKTIEGQPELLLVGDGKGHIKLNGQVVDQPGIGNRLNFTLQIDQTQLRTSIRGLEAVTKQFPVRTLNSSSQK